MEISRYGKEIRIEDLFGEHSITSQTVEAHLLFEILQTLEAIRRDTAVIESGVNPR